MIYEGVLFIMLSEFEKIQTLKQSKNKAVYLVREQKTDEIKIMKELDIKNESYFKLISLRHKNLQEVYDVFEENNKTYFICEYIMGEKLNFLIQNEKLTDEIIYSFILQLCDAVAFLHKQIPPIIHRDIKLSNIIVDNDYHLKLIDYDTIRELKTDREQDTAFVGTRGYAPPEQYGFSQTNEKTDIYAIGILIYRLLGGYNEQNISHYKGKYKRVIQKATAFSPEKRFHTVAQLKNWIHFERYKNWILISIFIIIIVITCLYITKSNITVNQNNIIKEATLGRTEEAVLCEFYIGQADYIAMGENKKFSIAPVFYDKDVLVPIEVLDNIPDVEYTFDEERNHMVIKRQNRKIEITTASNTAYVNNFEVITECRPVVEKSIYKIPISFVASNLGYYFQYNQQEEYVKVVSKNDDRIALNTNKLSFQMEKMSFNHEMPVLIGIKDREYEKTLNQYFKEQLEQCYDTYRELYDTTIINNKENTLFTHNNYVIRKYFTEDFCSILIIDNDAESLEDTDLNAIYRVQDFDMTYSAYNIDLGNKKFLKLDDIINTQEFKKMIREQLLYLSGIMDENYEYINEQNVDDIVSDMNEFFIDTDKTLTVYANLPEWYNMPILARFNFEEYQPYLK